MPIDPKWIVNLKGKEYPLWAGILAEAHKEGLLRLEVREVQVPAEANGWTAVVIARAEFKDGRVFQEIGDCNAKNTAPMIATASCRMAATRAKGRALRDALNIGQTMYEELPDAKLEAEGGPPQGGGRASGPGTATPYADDRMRPPAANGKAKAQPPLEPPKSSSIPERQEWLAKWQVLMDERNRLIKEGWAVAEVLLPPNADVATIQAQGKQLSAAIKAKKKAVAA